MTPRLHVSTRKGLFTVERQSGGWRIARTNFLGDNVTTTCADPRDGTLYASLNHGHFGVKLHRSRDGGASWQPVATPVYPPRPDGYTPRTPVEGTPVEWSLKLVWTIEAGGADEPGVLWAGTLPGGLFRSEDAGESWALNRPLWDDPLREEWFGGGADQPGIHSVLVDPRDSAHVTVGVSCGGVWTTRDRGATWAVSAAGMRAEYMPPERQFEPHVQDPHRIAHCRQAPDVMWAQHHNGIFRSDDGASTWREIVGVQPSTFGFAVAAHPLDPRTAWFVPAVKDETRYPAGGQVVVTRTRDGGQTFETLRAGLPQEHAYDLVYRHALDVDDTGELLAFGSTTGALWVSENGGDSWQTVSVHLPPVYALAFERGRTS